MKSALFLLLAGLLMLLGDLSVAQEPTGPQRPPDGGTREVLISILIPSLANAPFTATVNTESIKQLSDGTTITLKNHRAIARDKAGRIFQERRLLVPDDGKHESVVTQTEISDPVGHKLYICVPKERVCQLEQFSAPDFARPLAASTVANQPGGPSREDLGNQSIGGLEVAGTLETGVIESGAGVLVCAPTWRQSDQQAAGSEIRHTEFRGLRHCSRRARREAHGESERRLAGHHRSE